MVHVKWPSPSFKVDLEYENDEYYEKRFLPAYSTALRAPQTRGGKKNIFSKLYTVPYVSHHCFVNQLLIFVIRSSHKLNRLGAQLLQNLFLNP